MAVETIRAARTKVELVRLVAFDEETLGLYRGLLDPA